jgi:hypothetical protein
LVELKPAAADPTIPDPKVQGPLLNGLDGAAPTVVEYQGAHPEADKRTGLDALALDPYREVAIVQRRVVQSGQRSFILP